MIVVDSDRRSKSGSAVQDQRFDELFRVLRPTVGVMAELEARGMKLDSLSGTDVEAALRRELLESRRTETGWLRGCTRSKPPVPGASSRSFNG
jgi:hypothetical protein